MPTAIENARKRLEEIEAEAAEIRRFIAMYERFSDENGLGPTVCRPPHSEEKASPHALAVDNSGSAIRRAARSGPTPKELAELMERLIREVGRPMTRGEIVDAIERREVEIPGKDKGRYIGTIAWRNKAKFVNIDGRGYWLRGEHVGGPGAATYADPPRETSDDLPGDDVDIFT